MPIKRQILSLVFLQSVSVFALNAKYYDADAGNATIGKEELNAIPFYLKKGAVPNPNVDRSLALTGAFKKALVDHVLVNNNTLFVLDLRLAQCSESIGLILNRADDANVPYPKSPVQYDGTTLITTAHNNGFVGVNFSKGSGAESDAKLTVDGNGDQLFEIGLNASDYDLFINNQEAPGAEKVSELMSKLLARYEANSQENVNQCRLALKMYADFEPTIAKAKPRRFEYEEEVVAGTSGGKFSKPIEVGHVADKKRDPKALAIYCEKVG